MYSVARFSADPNQIPDIFAEVAKLVGACRPGADTGVDGIVGRFSCSISKRRGKENIEDIRFFLESCKDAIDRASQLNVRVCVDVAVEPEDRGGKPWATTVFDPLLLALLAHLGVELVITSYE